MEKICIVTFLWRDCNRDGSFRSLDGFRFRTDVMVSYSVNDTDGLVKFLLMNLMDNYLFMHYIS